MHSSILRNLLLAVAGAGAFAAVLGGCSTGSSSSSPSISPPPQMTTSSPPPSLFLVPASLTFPPGHPGTLPVTIGAPNPSFENVTIVGDTCTGPRIATAQPSPLPNPTPTPGTQPPIFNVTSGAKDGSCSFTFQDMVSLAKATLPVTNNSGGQATPSPPPSPTPTATSTGSGNVLTFVCPTGPCTSLTLPKGSGATNITVDYGSSGDAAATKTGDSCSGPGIASASPFDYGIWTITPGPHNGSCSFTFTDSTVNATGTLGIVNQSNAVKIMLRPH